MKFPSAAGTSSIASTSTPGASNNTRWPESCDSEAAVRANAMLMTSPRASFCFSVSNISVLLERSVDGCDNFLLNERLRYKSGSPFGSSHFLCGFLYICGGNDNTRLVVHLSDFVEYFQSAHLLHDEIEQHD